MRSYSRVLVSALCLLGAAVLATPPAGAGTIYYPDTQRPSFLVDVPDSWELEQAEQPGDYFSVTGPTNVVFSFRTIPGSEDAMQGAIEDSMAFLHETYSNLELGDAQDAQQHGLSGFFATGSGRDKSDGHPVGFAFAWFDLPNGTIGEIWFVGNAGDEQGAAAAGRILDSFRAP